MPSTSTLGKTQTGGDQLRVTTVPSLKCSVQLKTALLLTQVAGWCVTDTTVTFGLGGSSTVYIGLNQLTPSGACVRDDLLRVLGGSGWLVVDVGTTVGGATVVVVVATVVGVVVGDATVVVIAGGIVVVDVGGGVGDDNTTESSASGGTVPTTAPSGSAVAATSVTATSLSTSTAATSMSGSRLGVADVGGWATTDRAGPVGTTADSDVFC